MIIIRDIKKFSELKEDYYKPARAGYFYSSNYIKCESNGDRNKAASIRKYLEEIKQHLKDITNNLKRLIHLKSS